MRSLQRSLVTAATFDVSPIWTMSSASPGPSYCMCKCCAVYSKTYSATGLSWVVQEGGQACWTAAVYRRGEGRP